MNTPATCTRSPPVPERLARPRPAGQTGEVSRSCSPARRDRTRGPGFRRTAELRASRGRGSAARRRLARTLPHSSADGCRTRTGTVPGGMACRRREFGHGPRAGAADDEVGLCESGGHVVNEGQHLAIESRCAESLRDLAMLAYARLMDQPHLETGALKQRPALGCGPVQRLRSLAASRYQNREHVAGGPGGNSKNSRRTGTPVNSVLPGGNQRAVSGKLTALEPPSGRRGGSSRPVPHWAPWQLSGCGA